jgi:hypothetical protein
MTFGNFAAARPRQRGWSVPPLRQFMLERDDIGGIARTALDAAVGRELPPDPGTTTALAARRSIDMCVTEGAVIGILAALLLVLAALPSSNPQPPRAIPGESLAGG